MVAFAGRQHAARSVPIFVADDTNTVTSFTLVKLPCAKLFFFPKMTAMDCANVLNMLFLRFLNSRMAFSKIYFGRNLGAVRVLGMRLFA